MAVGSVPRETVVQMPEGGASMEAQQQESSAETAAAGPMSSRPRCTSHFFSWRVARAALGNLVILGWCFIIVILIMNEKWQVVPVACLLLFFTAQFCYWASLITLYRHIRSRVFTHSRNAEKREKADKPPTYNEVMKTEAPPPAYFTVVSEAFMMPPEGVSPCVPADVPSVSSCVEKQQSQAASGNMLTIEIRKCPPAYRGSCLRTNAVPC